jgi:hypothetical protein
MTTLVLNVCRWRQMGAQATGLGGSAVAARAGSCAISPKSEDLL